MLCRFYTASQLFWNWACKQDTDLEPWATLDLLIPGVCVCVYVYACCWAAVVYCDIEVR